MIELQRVWPTKYTLVQNESTGSYSLPGSVCLAVAEADARCGRGGDRAAREVGCVTASCWQPEVYAQLRPPAHREGSQSGTTLLKRAHDPATVSNGRSWLRCTCRSCSWIREASWTSSASCSSWAQATRATPPSSSRCRTSPSKRRTSQSPFSPCSAPMKLQGESEPRRKKKPRPPKSRFEEITSPLSPRRVFLSGNPGKDHPKG